MPLLSLATLFAAHEEQPVTTLAEALRNPDCIKGALCQLVETGEEVKFKNLHNALTPAGA